MTSMTWLSIGRRIRLFISSASIAGVCEQLMRETEQHDLLRGAGFRFGVTRAVGQTGGVHTPGQTVFTQVKLGQQMNLTDIAWV